MRNRKRRTAAVWAAAGIAAGMSLTAGAQEAVDIEELFHTYSSDNQVFDYVDAASVRGWDQRLEYKNYQGYLALEQLDLDQNGTEELLVVRIKQPDEQTGQNDLLAEIYEYEGDKLKRVAQCTLAEDVLHVSHAQIDVFLADSGNGLYLCCEDSELEALLANGRDWNLRTFSYAGGSFVKESETRMIGSAWEETDIQPARETLNTLGLYPAELVTVSIADQVNNLTRISSICRYMTASIEEISAYLSSPEEETMQYGETVFFSYANTDRETKLPKEFVSVAVHTEKEAESVTAEAQPQDYIIADSSSRYITEEELAGLSDYEILLARNEIYARHGRIFQNEELDTYFRSKTWYQPTVSGADFTESYAASVFNEFEVKNIDTIVLYEQAHQINQF